jgi:hypothetical protein
MSPAAPPPPVNHVQPIPPSARTRSLLIQQRRLELHMQRCEAAAVSGATNPSLGRELDDASAVLAKVRAELRALGN